MEFRSQADKDKHSKKCITVKQAQENPTIIQSTYEHCEHPLAYAKTEGQLKLYGIYRF